ncbi:MAG TPA: flagellar hook-basal body protein [Vicinamibacterales bacterium]|jgi:flagellar basal body rod protein FlgG|nr:flagellar hook-basal body protein [Vicinamibacterales bacterium]
MAGGYYVALSGMRTRIDQLDRLADEIANSSTPGFKGERAGHEKAPRPTFAAAFETAIDVTMGGRRLDTRAGTIVNTGQELDIALTGDGFLAVETPAGTRYTRNGHLARQPDGTITTTEGAPVLGEEGPIKVGTGPVQIEADGTVRSSGVVAGRLSVVEFADPRGLVREGGALLRAGEGAAPNAAAHPVVRAGSLEQSNVSVVERIAELTNVSRNFEALQRAVSVLMNDIDGRTIDSIGRR